MTTPFPLRVADAAATDQLDPVNLEALVKRTVQVFSPSESLADFTQASGEIALCVAMGDLGQLFFYDDTDTTTADDGLTCLVDGSGHRYKLEDSATVAVSSVLGETNTPAVGPTIGDAYIVGTAPTGAWSANAKDIAVYTRRGWVFLSPAIGTTVLNVETSENLQYSAGGVWDGFSLPIALNTGLGVEAQQNAAPGSPAAGEYYLVGTTGSGAFASHDNEIAYWSGTAWAFTTPADGAHVFNKSTDVELVWSDATGAWDVPSPVAQITQGRLTLQSAVAISTANQSAKTTIYFTPFRGKYIGLYVNGGWVLRAFSEISQSLSGATSGKPYDFFAYDNSGVVEIEKLVWTNDSTRATALTLQDGVYVKSGDPTRKYIGTIYTSGSGQTEDTFTQRYVINYWNRVPRPMVVQDTSNSWNYTTSTVREANGANNHLDFIVGVAEDAVEARVMAHGSSSAAAVLSTGIGYDSASAFHADGISCSVTPGSVMTPMSAAWRGIPAAGKHTLYWCEHSTASGTSTWYGDNGGNLVKSGMHATVFG